jgi:hypothetical protein
MGEFGPEQQPASPFLEQRRDKEFDRVRSFGSSLERLDTIQLADFSLDLDQPQPAEQFIKHFLDHERLGGAVLYLHPQYKLFTERDSVSIEPLVARTGKHSAHGVFFGNLVFDNQLLLPAAVKPHWDSPERSCMKDYLNNDAVNMLGLNSLQPLGFLLDRDGDAYSFTALEDSLTTLDTIDWSNFYPDINNNIGMREIWSQVARQLAYVHSIGSVMHGDLAARNIAIRADEGGVSFIDWERAHISKQQPRDAEVRYAYSHIDLSTLLESMCIPPHAEMKAGIGIFYDKPGDWWQGFIDLFYNEYRGLRLEYAEQGNHNGTVLTEVKDELGALEASLRGDMDMMQHVCASLPKQA